MEEETITKLKAIADALIETLDPNMDSKEADEIVTRCAGQIYTDVLGIEGNIIRTPSDGHVDYRDYKTGLLSGKWEYKIKFVPKDKQNQN
jgi:hypothetical protein